MRMLLSSRRKIRGISGKPARIPLSLATKTALPFRSSGIRTRLVTSPLPRSSSNARSIMEEISGESQSIVLFQIYDFRLNENSFECAMLNLKSKFIYCRARRCSSVFSLRFARSCCRVFCSSTTSAGALRKKFSLLSFFSV